MATEAENALDWMFESKLAKEITAEMTNPRSGVLTLDLVIVKPDLTIQELLLTKNGVNWVYQSISPAHGRKADGT
jgi:phage gp46-like protein